MLNFNLGSPAELDGHDAILTREDAHGHALFGPYLDLEAGSYSVSFRMRPADKAASQRDVMCALVDVAADTGSTILAKRHVRRSEITDGVVNLPFRLLVPANVEFRVWVNGLTRLIVSDHTILSPSNTPDSVASPNDADGGSRSGAIEALFHAGIRVELDDNEVVMLHDDFEQASTASVLHRAAKADTFPALLSDNFRGRPENDYYNVLCGGSAVLRGTPAYVGLTSSLCQQMHFSLDEFRFWMKVMHRKPRMHRKDWEWFFIAQALFDRGMLEPGKRGLAFAVGIEQLPAVFAARGCHITATDQSEEQAMQSGWINSNQYSSQVDSLFDERVCDRERFFSNVSYRSVDMNNIPSNLDEEYDFCWSSCAYEHLGSIERGIQFVENSMKTLKAGGVAVHTTEFNLSSNEDTLESESLSIFRKKDIE